MTYLEQAHRFYGVIRVEGEAVKDTSGDDNQVVFVDLGFASSKISLEWAAM